MNQSQLIDHLKKNPFVLAPMAGITDCVFRSLMRKHQAGVVISELVSAKGIKYDSKRTFALMDFEETQRPVGIQLFGEEPEDFALAAQVVEQHGADFVDLNFGCPVPKVVKKGGGSAVLKDLLQLEKICGATVRAVKIPVTIKIRTGWDETSKNASQVVAVAANQGVTWVSIHGRTRAQGYAGNADWNFISSVAAASPIPIIGNGDIHTAQQAATRLQSSGCAGVMIGRGALKNPFIFSEAMSLWASQDPAKSAGLRLDSPGNLDFRTNNIEALSLDTNNFCQILEELYSGYHQRVEERVLNIQLKKFSSWFSAGYPGSSDFRKKIFQLKNNDEVLKHALEFFVSINSLPHPDTSGEEFLMGGHG